MNDRSSYVMKNNTYRFAWKIKTLDSIRTAFKEGKEFVLHSPVLTAKCLGCTSWFLSIIFSESNKNHFVFYLNRNEEDGGAETVEIDWSIEVVGEDFRMDFQKEDKIIKLFKKGGSNRWGVLNVIKRIFLNRALHIICEMSERFPTKNPILEIDKARTKKENFIILDFGDKGIIRCFKYINCEITFYLSNAALLNITIHRKDNSHTISCYLMFFINIYPHKLCSQKLIWSGKIDFMHEAINSGDRIKKHLSDWTIPSNLSKNLFAKGECICTIVYDKKIVKTSNIANGNSIMKTLEIVDADDSVKETKNDNDSASKFDSLVSDLVQMYKNEIHSDVTLQVGSKTFKSHKCLLSARSSVFSAMFHQDIAEKQTGVVNITDIEASTLCLLLKFIYTNGVDDLETDSALKLLLAAEKYQIFSLKEMCSTYLTSDISENNVCDILNAADMVQHNGLKASAMEYVKKYAHKVLNSESWKQLGASNASVVAETLRRISYDLWTTTTEKLDS